MGKESKKKKEDTPKAPDETKAEEQDADDMPDDVREYKEKLERETGKKYKYRTPKKDLPSINDMLAYGAPGDENRPRTWLELIGYPALLVLLFCVSLSIFWWINPIENSRYKRGRFSLPKKPPAAAGGATGSMPKKADTSNDEF